MLCRPFAWCWWLCLCLFLPRGEPGGRDAQSHAQLFHKYKSLASHVKRKHNKGGSSATLPVPADDAARGRAANANARNVPTTATTLASAGAPAVENIAAAQLDAGSGDVSLPHGYPSALQQSLDDVNAQLVRLAGANVAPLVPARLEALVTKTALDAFASKGVTPLPQVVVRLWPVAAGGHAVGRAPPRCAAATASAADDADDHQQRTTKQGGDVPPVLDLGKPPEQGVRCERCAFLCRAVDAQRGLAALHDKWQREIGEAGRHGTAAEAHEMAPVDCVVQCVPAPPRASGGAGINKASLQLVRAPSPPQSARSPRAATDSSAASMRVDGDDATPSSDVLERKEGGIASQLDSLEAAMALADREARARSRAGGASDATASLSSAAFLCETRMFVARELDAMPSDLADLLLLGPLVHGVCAATDSESSERVRRAAARLAASAPTLFAAWSRAPDATRAQLERAFSAEQARHVRASGSAVSDAHLSDAQALVRDIAHTALTFAEIALGF